MSRQRALSGYSTNANNGVAGDLKADVISNLIKVSNVPDDPDHVVKDLVESLVSKADSGSAEAKALLNNLLQKLLEKIK